MKNKWKYATVSADERLGMVRNGNKDVYNSEMERSLDAVKRNSAEGLDISAQKNWIDSLSYNYNLYNAERMGIPANKVNKTGYADRILGTSGGSGKSKSKYLTSVSSKADGNYYAKKYLTEFYGKVKEAEAKRENVREWLVNNGIDEKSDTGKKYMDEFDKELEAVTEKYRNEYFSKLLKVIKQ